MRKSDYSSWEKEFAEFLRSETTPISNSVSDQVLIRVQTDLRPSPLSVFGKLSMVQFGVGLFTLIFCPQFGISLSSSAALMPYLMQFGESVCMLGCGALFLGLSLLLASFTLRPEEVRVLRRNEALQLATLSTLSLGAFICVGGEVVLTLGLIWILGALVGGALSLELGWALRQSLAERSFS